MPLRPAALVLGMLFGSAAASATEGFPLIPITLEEESELKDAGETRADTDGQIASDTQSENPSEKQSGTQGEPEPAALDPLGRWWPALAATGTSALVSIPLGAFGVGGATGVCLYTLGLGGLFSLPCALTPLACGACGGAVGALVGLWTAGDDLCQPLSIASGAGLGFLGGALGLLVGGLVTLAAWGRLAAEPEADGGSSADIGELAIGGGAVVGLATAISLALASAVVGGYVALLPPRPPPSGEVRPEQPARLASPEAPQVPSTEAAALAY